MKNTLTEATLRALAGPRSYERGLGYLDAVTGVEIDETRVTATVHGTERYEVELNPDGPDGPTGRCDCPYGLEGNFCKHLVALGLTLLARPDTLPRRRKAAKARTRTLDTWLNTLSKEDLLAVVREEIAEDRALRRRLELRAACARADLPAIRSRVRALLDIAPFARYGYVEYADARAYALQAGQAVTALRTLVASPRPADAVTLVREAMASLAEASEAVDDSDGGLGQVAADLSALHLEACRAARPDPRDLVGWLVAQALDEANDLFDVDPLDYADVLGTRGTALLRDEALRAWRANRTGWAEKYLMERLTEATGDTDALIALHAADLAPNGHTHLLIARELDAAGRPEEALAWAERGIRDSVDLAATDTALIDDVCDRYTRTNRLTDAVTLRRAHFDARHTLLTYRQLRTVAQAEGCWRTERERALATLRADTAHRPPHQGRSLLVDILLDEDETDAAWRTATGTGADDSQWLTLADRVRPTRPADALAVYLRLAAPLTRRTGNTVYERLADLLLNIRDCHHHLGTTAEFTTYLADLRATQKRKRNLLRLLDERGL